MDLAACVIAARCFIRPIAAADHRNHTELPGYLGAARIASKRLEDGLHFGVTKLGCEALPIEPFQC